MQSFIAYFCIRIILKQVSAMPIRFKTLMNFPKSSTSNQLIITMKKAIIFVLLAALSISLNSCSSVTEVTGTWKKPGATSQKYNKIVVLGVSKDIVKRSTVENAVASNLKSYGINAVSGTNLITDTFLDSDNDGKVDASVREKIVAELKAAGVDGAFVISLVDKKEEERYVPGTYSYGPTYSPYAGYYGFNSYYYGAWNNAYSPGYYTKQTNYFFASNFYNVGTEQLVWSAQSETFNPQSMKDFAQSYAKSTVEEFVASGVVRK
jgi:hypothetical protein